MTSFGEAAIGLLAEYGVTTVFGIPGVHTLELYRGLPGSGVRHVTPRHEQGGGFMADGWARVTGRPGVCLVITGPGVTNALTPAGQAHHDSQRMLILSSAVLPQGHARGAIHDLPDQRGLTSAVTAFSRTIREPDELPEALADAWDVFESRRPRPVHIEIPVDVLRRESGSLRRLRPASQPAPPDPAQLRAAADLLSSAANPVVLVGGGAIDAGAEALRVAERLDAPVGVTINARGAVASGHPLCVSSAMCFSPVSELLLDADAMLAVGTEFSELDWWGLEGEVRPPARLVRIDIDPAQFDRFECTPVLGDSAAALAGIAELLGERSELAGRGAERVARALGGLRWPAEIAEHLPLLEALDRALPEDRIVTADSTQPAYAANHAMPAHRPRSWLMPIGFGCLGCALPMAVGAKLAAPERPVATLVGDGGLLFTIQELATACDLGLPIPIVVWNNHGYGEIRDSMDRAGIPPIGTDTTARDLVTIAQGFGCAAVRTSDPAEVEGLVAAALCADRPTLVEVRP